MEKWMEKVYLSHTDTASAITVDNNADIADKRKKERNYGGIS